MTVVNNFTVEVEKFKLNFTQDDRNQHDVVECANRSLIICRRRVSIPYIKNET